MIFRETHFPIVNQVGHFGISHPALKNLNHNYFGNNKVCKMSIQYSFTSKIVEIILYFSYDITIFTNVTTFYVISFLCKIYDLESTTKDY